VEELCLDVCFVAYLEVRRRHAPAISVLLIVCLGVLNICLEGIVEFSKIDSELPSMAGGHVAFRVHFNDQMISLVGEEWPGPSQARWCARPGVAPGLGFDFMKPQAMAQAVAWWLCHVSHLHHQTQWASLVSAHWFPTFSISI